MVSEEAALETVWGWLGEIEDPEIPVISILDLGIVRDVTWSGTGSDRALRVAITPTYSGCPAIAEIERAILAKLHAHRIDHVVLERRLFPSWTTDWLTDAGREKLRAYGISPPQTRAADPHAQRPGDRLRTIDGQVPPPGSWPVGCRFAARCEWAAAACREAPVELVAHGTERRVRCVRADEIKSDHGH